MSYVRTLKCLNCGKEYRPEKLRYNCDECKSYLEVTYNFNKIKKEVDREEVGIRNENIMSKWREFLPINDLSLIDKVSLGEMATPLIKSNNLGEIIPSKNIFLKNDTVFPTQSLKDRSMPFTILKGMELGQGSPSIVSSGNAAASLSAYCARSGQKAVVFVGENAEGPRIIQALMSGAFLIFVKSDYSTVSKLYEEAIKKFNWYDCNGIVNPFRLESKKLYAHEISCQFNWDVPDSIILPMAGGNGIIAIGKGFEELKEIGWIDRIPKIYGIQPENCSPIVDAFEKDEEIAKDIIPHPTIAGSIAVSKPGIGGAMAIKTVKKVGGGMVKVSEAEIEKAQNELANREGIFCEPAGSIGLAGLKKLLSKGIISKEEKTVIILTGHGLKQLPEGPRNCGKLVEINPKIEDPIRKIKEEMSNLFQPLSVKRNF